MIEHPNCFDCEKEIIEDPVYESLCGHDECASACWHASCLMRFRDLRQRAETLAESMHEVLREMFGG